MQNRLPSRDIHPSKTKNNIPIYLTLALSAMISSFPSSVSAQTYSFKHYSSADGLELSSVSTVFQDSKGSVWFGGIGGAFRYDGYRFTPYLTQGTERAVVTRFEEDKSGAVWMATEGKGIAKVHYGENNSLEWMTSRQNKLPSDSVYSLLPDSGGVMWIGTRYGVLVLWGDGTSTHLTRESGLYHNWVRGIRKDHEGRVWVATNGGVTRCTVHEKKIVSMENIFRGFVIALTVRSDGTIVFGTNEGTDRENKGIFAYKNGAVERIVRYDDFSEPIKPQTLYEDSKSVLWIGTTRGCLLKTGNSFTRIRTAQGLSNESIGGVLEDREGSIWLATGNGAMKLPRRYTLNYTELQGLIGTIFLTVLADKFNNVWFGGYSLLHRIGADGNVQFLDHEPLLVGKAIYSLADDRDGNVWIGTQAGLLMYDGKKFSEQRLSDTLPPPFAPSVARADDGGVWVGVKGEILKIQKRKIVTTYRQSDGIANADIKSLLVDHDHRLWYATNGGGAGSIDNGIISQFGSQNGLPSDDVELIKEDSKGRIWFITAGGVAYWKEGEFYRLTAEQFPYEHLRVTTLHEDRNGHMWFGTWFGVIEWSDSVLAHFDTRDGLTADFVNAIAEDGSGNLWFATGGGLTKFPKLGRAFAIPEPTMFIDRISDESERKIVTSQTRLAFTERTVTFQFSSMSFFDERNMEFQYMLGSIESDWNPPTKQRIARYTTLPAGTYTLQARARNRNGAWTQPAKYSFLVLPPFWETWWFRLLVLFVIAIAMFAIYRYRVSKLLELERLRLRIATDLHDEIGSYLGSIALESEITQRKLQVSDEVRQRLGKIAGLSRRTAEAMRDIVWVINPEHDSMETLGMKMKEVAAQMLIGIPHNFKVSSENPHSDLDLDFKRNFYLIYKETLHNILKHAQATHVDITIEQRKKQITMRVADNGSGFDEQTVKPGNGLKNIRTRAAKMGARLLLMSKSGEGTTVDLTANIP